MPARRLHYTVQATYTCNPRQPMFTNPGMERLHVANPGHPRFCVRLLITLSIARSERASQLGHSPPHGMEWKGEPVRLTSESALSSGLCPCWTHGAACCAANGHGQAPVDVPPTVHTSSRPRPKPPCADRRHRRKKWRAPFHPTAPGTAPARPSCQRYPAGTCRRSPMCTAAPTS